ncbi:acyltransferase [Cryobacterium sp. TMT2-42-4]|uniref:acyltransferase family protein n=1 Tax=Cryobacterium sp. TMT2-42-4 TaxID=1259255 RepID=UPI00106A5D03|nr:acyltransferase [Cryobacterium sp. TMT2-42-4]TFC33959.1 acyltransferase [Cryobacterium sp. TMT2-42-4]
MSTTRPHTLAPQTLVSADNGPINILRTVAALFVVLGHARTLLLVDYDNAPHNGAQVALYGVTAIGHQAVVVFFVLSGYWVGGSLLRKARQGRFSWPSYLADRTTRLWVVLVPALVLTLALDAIGRRYFGAMTAYVGDPRYGGVALDQRPIDGLTFFGNVFFMGGIRVPTFGSNTALWSLGFEFWMYVIAAIILLAFFVRGRSRLILIVVAIGSAFLVGDRVLVYVPVWLLGALVATSAPRLDRWAHRINPRTLLTLRLTAGFAALGAAVAVRGLNSLPTIVGDYIVAVPAAVLMATLTTGFIKESTERTILGKFSTLANSSFSLYAIHVPILVLLVSALGIQVNNRWPSDLLHWTYLLIIVAGLSAGGWVFAKGTEMHTDRIRRAVKSRLGLR